MNAEKIPRTIKTRYLPEDEWQECKEHFSHTCAYCGQPAKLERDHVIPIKNGGKFVLSNVVPACNSCNAQKKAQEMEKWFREQDFFTDERLLKIKSWLKSQEGVIRYLRRQKPVPVEFCRAQIPKELHDKLRLAAFETRKSQNAIVTEALAAYLKEEDE